jgi:pteridine reductase
MSTRVALVTGAARRIGRATALELARAGYRVIAVVRTLDDDARSLADELRSLDRLAELAPIDLQLVSCLDVIASLVQRCGGTLDLLVHNASLYEPDDGDEGPSIEQTRRLMRINYVIPHQLTMRLAPLLRASQGCVINLVDLMAEQPWPKYSGYCAAKAALANATLSLSRRLAPEARVIGVAPGMVGAVKAGSPDDADAYLRRVPLGRAGGFDEIACFIRFLAADATYLTGQIIPFDGGRSARL